MFYRSPRGKKGEHAPRQVQKTGVRRSPPDDRESSAFQERFTGSAIPGGSA
ncbi:hypothetical protein JW906_02920 [bacterium]|nr:hypothetical protein [bacterium]